MLIWTPGDVIAAIVLGFIIAVLALAYAYAFACEAWRWIKRKVRRD